MKAKCPECGYVLDLPESISGVSCICEKCGKIMMIPGNMGVLDAGTPVVDPPEEDDRPMDALDHIIAEKRQQYAAQQAGQAAMEDNAGTEKDIYGLDIKAGRGRRKRRSSRNYTPQQNEIRKIAGKQTIYILIFIAILFIYFFAKYLLNG